jgi:hypothetical protein
MYVSTFKAASIDGIMLMKHVAELELRSIGVSDALHLKKILDAISHLKSKASSESSRRDKKHLNNTMASGLGTRSNHTLKSNEVARLQLERQIISQQDESIVNTSAALGESKFYRRLMEDVIHSKELGEYEPPKAVSVPANASLGESIEYIRFAIQEVGRWLRHLENIKCSSGVLDDDFSVGGELDEFSIESPPPPYDNFDLKGVSNESLVFQAFVNLENSSMAWLGTNSRLTR